jgi:hypothetical protein
MGRAWRVRPEQIVPICLDQSPSAHRRVADLVGGKPAFVLASFDQENFFIRS